MRTTVKYFDIARFKNYSKLQKDAHQLVWIDSSSSSSTSQLRIVHHVSIKISTVSTLKFSEKTNGRFENEN